jgi:hypothetical protein
MSDQALASLEGVPLLLESRDPRVLERIYPETCQQEDAEADWREHAVPELERLFASRGTIVRKDLAAMRASGEGKRRVLKVTDGHVNAWLASLNAARLALYALNDLKPEWMGGRPADEATLKQREAIARIHLLAELQSVLLGDYQLLEVAEEDLHYIVDVDEAQGAGADGLDDFADDDLEADGLEDEDFDDETLEGEELADEDSDAADEDDADGDGDSDGRADVAGK